MLILQRKSAEKVEIFASSPDHIEVKVLDICGDKVRLGFTAAASTKIHRQEVWVAIEAEKQAAGVF